MFRADILQKVTQANGQRDKDTEGHISLTGPHWGPLDYSVGINASRNWTPTLHINTNKKLQKA